MWVWVGCEWSVSVAHCSYLLWVGGLLYDSLITNVYTWLTHYHFFIIKNQGVTLCECEWSVSEVWVLLILLICCEWVGCCMTHWLPMCTHDFLIITSWSSRIRDDIVRVWAECECCSFFVSGVSGWGWWYLRMILITCTYCYSSVCHHTHTMSPHHTHTMVDEHQYVHVMRIIRR